VLSLPAHAKDKTQPFRWVGVVRKNGAVVVLQQCVPWDKETLHELKPGAGERHLQELGGGQDWPALNEALCRACVNMPAGKKHWITEHQELEDLLGVGMEVEHVALLRRPEKGCAAGVV